jgi:methylenetetrahydrofolate--tRNA-(uracil-5-)-methyltransferase
MGWLAGLNAARLASAEELLVAPSRSAIGALARYVSSAETKNYQPVNITFALLEPLTKDQARSVKRKRDRHTLQVNLALKEWDEWRQQKLTEAIPASAV